MKDQLHLCSVLLCWQRALIQHLEQEILKTTDSLALHPLSDKKGARMQAYKEAHLCQVPERGGRLEGVVKQTERWRAMKRGFIYKDISEHSERKVPLQDICPPENSFPRAITQTFVCPRSHYWSPFSSLQSTAPQFSGHLPAIGKGYLSSWKSKKSVVGIKIYNRTQCQATCRYNLYIFKSFHTLWIAITILILQTRNPSKWWKWDLSTSMLFVPGITF